jgi:hypothetical protein
MKKYYLFLFLILTVSIVACDDDDDKVEVKDYGQKTFKADLDYDTEAAHGEVAYKKQTYFSFSKGDTISTAIYGTDSWTSFYLLKDSAATNFTSSVEGWDIVFSNYTANLGTEESPIAYRVTGVLTNINKDIEVAKYNYEEYTKTDSISKAFSNFTLADVSNLEFSTEIDAIGYGWKSVNMETLLYTLHTNYFYIVKLDAETYYKMRFVDFYGENTDERIAKIEYQLMQ